MAVERDQFTPKPDLTLGRYQHYKGNLYEVVYLACHSETHQWQVIYRSFNPKKGVPDVWARPYEMFIENVKVDGKEVPRFKKVDELGAYSSSSY